MLALETRVEKAVEKSIDFAIKQLGINGLRRLSMFPSSQKPIAAFKIAA